jgi:hypothetical protein
MVMMKLLLPPLFVAVNRKVSVCTLEGVPLITPVDASYDRPFGSVPLCVKVMDAPPDMEAAFKEDFLVTACPMVRVMPVWPPLYVKLAGATASTLIDCL